MVAAYLHWILKTLDAEHDKLLLTFGEHELRRRHIDEYGEYGDEDL